MLNMHYMRDLNFMSTNMITLSCRRDVPLLQLSSWTLKNATRDACCNNLTEMQIDGPSKILKND